MESIRQAVELAKGAKSELPQLPAQPPLFEPASSLSGTNAAAIKEVTLDSKLLEKNRIIGHDRLDLRSRFFDMLRTQVLQVMDLKSWQFLAITSPSPNCGKTLTSINLALSIGRQSERSVLLVDMDLEKPQVANYLGLPRDNGILGVVEGRQTLQNALVQVRAGNSRMTVLPCEESTIHASERMTSRAMSTMLQDIKNADRSRIIIFDLPPILSGDNVISILPQMDSVLFVAAVGTTTASEVKECNKHLQTSAVIRVVLNKTSDLGPTYY